MNGFFAICITILFAGWIWYLKQQVSNLENELASVTPHGSDSSSHRHAPVNVHRDSHADMVRRSHSNRRARTPNFTLEGGIRTWTIS